MCMWHLWYDGSSAVYFVIYITKTAHSTTVSATNNYSRLFVITSGIEATFARRKFMSQVKIKAIRFGTDCITIVFGQKSNIIFIYFSAKIQLLQEISLTNIHYVRIIISL